jgi:hypothetical protein
MFNDWHDFFSLAGTSGATLVGLTFVVVTLGTRLSTPDKIDGIRAFLTPTLVHFGSVLLLAMVVLAHWPSTWSTGIVLGLQGAAGLAYEVKIVFVRLNIDFVTFKTLDWIPHTGFPVLANASLIAGGAGLIAGRSFGPYAVAGACVLLLMAGVYGAWDLTLWIIKNRDQP